jgi:hypothetical protein
MKGTMEKGWLKLILQQASADWETWPAWQRGFEGKACSDEAQIAEAHPHKHEVSDRKAAA